MIISWIHNFTDQVFPAVDPPHPPGVLPRGQAGLGTSLRGCLWAPPLISEGVGAPPPPWFFPTQPAHGQSLTRSVVRTKGRLPPRIGLLYRRRFWTLENWFGFFHNGWYAFSNFVSGFMGILNSLIIFFIPQSPLPKILRFFFGTNFVDSNVGSTSGVSVFQHNVLFFLNWDVALSFLNPIHMFSWSYFWSHHNRFLNRINSPSFLFLLQSRWVGGVVFILIRLDFPLFINPPPPTQDTLLNLP